MDKEVKNLCNAINKFKGLKTYSSCSGHDKKPLEIWFRASYPRAMYPLLRAIDMRYGGPDGGGGKPWFVEAMDTDLPRNPVTFVLMSRTIGESAYEEAKIIAENLLDISKDKRVVEHFNIKLKGNKMKKNKNIEKLSENNASNNSKDIEELGKKFSEGMNNIAESEQLMERIKQHNLFAEDMGMSEDAAFFISYIIGRLSQNVGRAKMRKYMAETVELVYDMKNAGSN